MNELNAIKQRLLPYFLERLRQTGIPQPSYPEELADTINVHYIAPGQRIEQSSPCLFFLAHGLLKEYYRSKRSVQPSSLVQLLMPDDLWVYNRATYKFRTRALLPTWLLEISLDKLHCIIDTSHSLRLWLEQLEMCYRSKHCFSSFLKAQPDQNERILFFLEEYGPYIDFLSSNEIQHYTGLNKWKIEKLRAIAFLYQRFDYGNILL